MFVCFVALHPKSTAMVMEVRSVHLTTLFPGRYQTQEPWICSQARICCQTCYRLRYTVRYTDRNVQHDTRVNLFFISCFYCKANSLASNEKLQNAISHQGIHCLVILKPVSLTFYLLVSSADNLCKQIGPRLGLTRCGPDLDQNCLTC